jgi:AcrR family transcriptional regulator
MVATVQKPKKTRRDIQKEETRRIILESAYKLFAERGYAKTTMRDLATDSGVALGTAFKHFPDKSSLLTAAFEEDIHEVVEQAVGSLPDGDIYSQLRHLVHAIYSFYAKDPDLSRALVKEALFIDGPAGDTIKAQAMRFLEGVGNLLQDAANRGEIQPIGPVLEAASGFWSFYLLGIIIGLSEPQFNVDQQVDFVDKLLQKHFPKTDKQK